MESPGSRRDQSTAGDLYTRLTEVYRCFLTGSDPGRSAADVARVILSGVWLVIPATSTEYHSVSSAELTCISLTLLEKIASNVMSQKLLYYKEVLRVLLKDVDIMPRLVHLFQSDNLIISHLAAKCVSACVIYNLHKSGMLSPVWQKKCVQTFHSSHPGTELDVCVWSVNEVLKKLIKGAHQEFVGILVAAFDSSLCALCSKLLPEERKEAAQCFTGSSHWGTTVCLLLDLLELLAASRLIFGTSGCLESQKLTYTRSSAILAVISSTSETFIKRRALLLLKRAVSHKVGEDWALGAVSSPGFNCDHLNSDVCMLGQSVLTAVADNWLERVQVEPSSFFGGTRYTRADKGLKPDSVMLRAVSLIILKSIELHIQTAARTGVDSATEVYGHLQNLWGFLRRCSIQLTEVTHLCCWISLLFGEQDDDMMEAARALLSIFLNHRPCSGLDGVAVLKAACASGCNPHCHFVLLLQSVSFDHSTLLDFLISTETCFLEYFVRYLKYLRDDWHGFITACGGISVASCDDDDRCALTHKDKPGSTLLFNSCVQPTDVNPPVERFGLVHLVDYDSSDPDSDPENMEVEEGASVCEKPALQHKQNDSSTVLLSDPNPTLETRPQGHSLPLIRSEPTSCTNTAPLTGQVTCEISTRAVICLSELREVVTRLQTKKLFPYNPSALLKLLAQVEYCHQQSHPSH